MPNPQIELTVLGDGLRVVGPIRFNKKGCEEFAVKIVFPVESELPKSPNRNPLHRKALGIENLWLGLNIQRYSTNDNPPSPVALINGEPFQHNRFWRVPVVTTNDVGKLIHEDWSLEVMGVVPYESADGISHYWHDYNYTLAVQ